MKSVQMMMNGRAIMQTIACLTSLMMIITFPINVASTMDGLSSSYPIMNDGETVRYYSDTGSIIEFNNNGPFYETKESKVTHMLPISSVFHPQQQQNDQQQQQQLSLMSNGHNVYDTIHSNQPDSHRIETRAAKQHLCGEMLISALQLVCKGNYKKRNGQVLAMDRFMGGEGQVPSMDQMFEMMKKVRPIPMTSKHDENMILNKYRGKRGVVDECCKKPCTTATLQQYCSY